MAALPTGTVTMLFTDIDGSTRLLEEVGTAAYAGHLEEHRRLVRGAFARHDGREVDTAGDAFFVAFSSATAAVSAAAEAQSALAGGPIVVRMGLHTGEPVLQDASYVGRDVHLAARVMSAGHGGQVLLTRATRELAGDVEVRDLGDHRLKDFPEPVRLFQLGNHPFPPLKTISNTNLPRPVSSFVGREREIADVVSLVRSGERLVTLTGPGGSGKTRLGLEAAAELVGDFKAGVFWVGLASLRDPALVLETIGQTIGAKGDVGAHIGDRELLLLVDNLEQVVGAASELADLVEAAGNLTLLVTSRELLRVRGEVEYQVLPLAEPDAVSLFCARAQLEPTPAVAELCRRLDAMPLALELAAARTRALSPEQILERLARRLDLLKGGRDADPRQQTLRATIEWSHDLLDADEQKLFARLAVFAGGFTLEAAERVVEADLDGLQSLVEKSLVRRGPDRFWLLETIRDFAAERLAASEERPALRHAHAEWVLDWVSHVEMRGDDQAEALRAVRDELPNIRLAQEELVAAGRACDRLLLAARLGQAMFHLGILEESKSWLLAALVGAEECPTPVRAEALVAASMQCTLTGETELGRRHAEEARDLAEGIGDPRLRLDALMAASTARIADDPQVAQSLAAEALAQAEELGDRHRAIELRNNLGYIALMSGDHEAARAATEAGIEAARAAGNHAVLAGLYHNLALVGTRSGAIGDAARCLREGLAIARLHALRGTQAYIVEAAASLAWRAGDHELAATLLGATESSAPDVGSVERELRLEAEREAHSALGDEAFRERCAAGSALSLEDASELAGQWLVSGHESRS